MNIAICDDESLICQEIKQIIQATPAEIIYQIYEYYSAKELISSGINFDMVFLDIELNNSLDGLQLAKILQDKNPDLILIFISAYPKYITSALYLHTFQFLIKPIKSSLLQAEFLRGLDKYKLIHSKYTFKHYSEKIILEVNDIVYIESQKRKLIIKLRNYKTYECYGKINEQQDLITIHNFIRPNINNSNQYF